MMSSDIARIDRAPQEIDRFMPVFGIEQAVARRQAIVEATAKLMQKDIDYGIIPGTPKPTLLKPGAEKLCTLFGLSPEFVLEQHDEDWNGSQHGGEPFFCYRYRCRLSRSGYVIGEGEGSCNSWEVKYRWRKGERKCPACGSTAIIKGKAEYGGGWVCFKKKGGCGAKFTDGDSGIESQEVDRIKNPDIYDQVNTLQKMAQKRAMIAATLIAVNASEFYTQDLEDITHDIDTGGHPAGTKAAAQAVATRKITQIERKEGQKPLEVLEIWGRMRGIKSSCEEIEKLKQRLIGAIGPAGETEYYRVLANYEAKHSNELPSIEKARLCAETLWKVIHDAQELRGPQPAAAILDGTDLEAS